jgi:hypothetical protein
MILAARPRSLTRHSTGSIWLNVANRRFQRTWPKSHRLAGLTERTVKTDLRRQTTQICASRAGKINVSKHVHGGIGAASRNNRDIKSLSRNKLIAADLSPKASEMPLPREALLGRCASLATQPARPLLIIAAQISHETQLVPGLSGRVGRRLGVFAL